MRFYHDTQLITLENVPADLTVLDWLRLHQHKTGTKEGCGSGDCGACTVVVASAVTDEAGNTELNYESVNSCITFVGALHGKQLITVENLGTAGVLHPVQQAMVQEHGSQCGFCTPGIVMSLYALYQRDEPEDHLREKVDQALGGNLCRCTGYRPIKQAANRALEYRTQVRITQAGSHSQGNEAAPLSATSEVSAYAHQHDRIAQTTAMAEQLIAITAIRPSLPGFQQPVNLADLAEQYQQQPQARLLGGGTDMALEVTQQLKDLSSIIHVGHVAELKCIEIHDDHVLLGAAVTLTQCLEIMGERIPGAHELLLRFGSDQVRNQATIGGNIGSASPIGDLAPLLLALDAQLHLQCGSKARSVALKDHFIAYRQTGLQAGEFIRQVYVPLPLASSLFSVHKVSKRCDDDISSVCLAAHIPQEQGICTRVRLAFGGMAAIPIRAVKAEQALSNQALSEQSIKAARQCLAEELTPLSDARASADYRLQVAQNLLTRIYREAHP